MKLDINPNEKILYALIGVVLVITGSIFYVVVITPPKSNSNIPLNLGEDLPLEERIEHLLSLMTVEEKIAQLHGVAFFDTADNNRLMIPGFRMSDGPHGVRDTFGPATSFPVGIAMTSTWDTNLITRIGTAMGKEFQAKGRNQGLGPCIDLQRDPRNGRSAESAGEDPYLAGWVGTSLTQGIQSTGTIATVKHYAAVNRQTGRNSNNYLIDERSLLELYGMPFRFTVQKGKVQSVMSAYHYINGEPCSANYNLLTDILRDTWGYDYYVVSDWWSIYQGAAKSIKAGVDVDMPGETYGGGLMEALELGQQIDPDSPEAQLFDYITEDSIDQAVRRVLRTKIVSGMIEHRPGQEIKFTPTEARYVRMMGLTRATDYGYSLYEFEVFGNQTGRLNNLALHKKVTVSSTEDSTTQGSNAVDGKSNTRWSSQFSDPQWIQIDLGDIYTVDKVALNWESAHGEIYEIQVSTSGDEWTTVYSTTEGPTYRYHEALNSSEHQQLALEVAQKSIVLLKNEDDVLPLNATTIESIALIGPSANVTQLDGFGSSWVTPYYSVTPKQGIENQAPAIYVNYTKGCDINSNDTSGFTAAKQAAAAADVVIFVGGLDQTQEGEGYEIGGDRKSGSVALPGQQQPLINELASVNPNVIVVLESGGICSVEQSLSNIKGLLYAFYPGQEGGTAIADILFGDINPSGKLPVTMPINDSQLPGRLDYDFSGDVLNGFGYRRFDSLELTPRYPFGYGLSYTNFSYDNLVVDTSHYASENTISVSVDITNTGSTPGEEIVQLYLSSDDLSVPMPIKQLKGFDRVSLDPTQTKTVTFLLGPDELSYWSTTAESYLIEEGSYSVQVGRSSQELPLHGTFMLNTSQLYDSANQTLQSTLLPTRNPHPKTVQFKPVVSQQRSVNIRQLVFLTVLLRLPQPNKQLISLIRN